MPTYPPSLYKAVQIAREEPLIKAGELVFAAVSGGRDSLFLLALLLALRGEIDFDLRLAHLNHGLRPEADAEAEFVRAIAQAHELPLTLKSLEPGLIEVAPEGIEAAARRYRQSFYQELVTTAWRDEGYAVPDIKIALGHHADDLAESMVLQLSRGTGLAGLVAMRPRDHYLIRPLLSISRALIDAYFDETGQEYVEDSSNSDQSFKRNAIRHSLLPQWSEIMGHDVRRSLCRLAKNLLAIEPLLDESLERDLLVIQQAGGALSRLRLCRLSRERQALLLHRYIRGQDYRQAPQASQIAQIIRRINRGGGFASFDLGGGRQLLLMQDLLFIENTEEY